MGKAQALCPGLRVLVHIVVLNLAEVPVIGLHQPAEHGRAPVVREPQAPNLPSGQLLLEPAAQAHIQQPMPGGCVCEHVYQVEVNIVCAQPAQLLLKDFLRPGHRLDQIVGQLGGNIHLLPAAQPPQQLAQSRLVAGIRVSCVKIVDSALDGSGQLLLRLIQIHCPAFFGEAHTPIAQPGDFPALFVLAVLHMPALLLPLLYQAQGQKARPRKNSGETFCCLPAALP